MNIPISARMCVRFRFRVRVMLVAVVVLKCTGSVASPVNADAQAGRVLFMQKGCYECHGMFGQGSISTGPALAPHPVPLATMQAYVHDPKGQMPPFSANILSNAEIAQIHAYLDAIPPNPRADSIALLNGGTLQRHSTAEDSLAASPAPAPATNDPARHGASIYAANCAACHGQNGEGGVGPALIDISHRLSIRGIESRIREPSGVMPKFYPDRLDGKDVQDVARYVASLK